MLNPFRKWILIIASLSLFSLFFVVKVDAPEQYSDPIVESVIFNGLVTNIRSSKTVDMVTVTLDWVYADIHLLMVGYTVKTSGSPKAKALMPIEYQPRLNDEKGASFSPSHNQQMFIGDDGALSMVARYYSQVTTPIEGTNKFDINNDYFNPPPDKLNLTFDLMLGDFSPSQRGHFTNSSTKPADYVEPVGPFIFDFSTPLHQPTVTIVHQSFSLKGVEMTLQQVMLTPSITSAIICYTLPDARDWMPSGSITLNDVPGLLAKTSLVGGKETDITDAKTRCRDFTFNVFYESKPTTLTVSVDYIAVPISEGGDDWNRIKTELARHNIKIDVISTGHGLRVKTLSVPEGVNYNQAVIEARKVLGDWLQGPWTFKVNLPAA